MDIGESIGILGAFMDKESLCEGVKDKEGDKGQCRIGKPGNPGDLETPTASRLHSSMKNAKMTLPAMPRKLSVTADGKGKKMWDLEDCTTLKFPFQSHHMIPKMHLPEHDVCVWLAKKAGTGTYQLTASTTYDTDDARNGIPLPFASTTQQWELSKTPTVDDARQIEICNRMMEITAKQLHQGSHTYEDFGEEDNLHGKEKVGYLGAVDELLEVVNSRALAHYSKCNDCSGEDSNPKKIRPLERIVTSVHQASTCMSSIIGGNKRFVSERAAKYWQARRK